MLRVTVVLKMLLPVLIVIGLAAPSARATIVIGVGAHGLELGDSGKEVKSELGKPNSIQKYKGGQSWFFDGYWITLTTKRIVRGIEIADEKQKTSKGIGLGSKLKRLKAAYPAIKCRPHQIADRICSLPTRKAGKTIPTNFVFFDSEVKYVDIGSVGEFG